MAGGDVGDVLKKLHRALRPGGLLLDIHPVRQRPRVEVGAGANIFCAGHLEEPGLFDRIHTAQSALASAEAARVFVREREMEFDFLYHFDTVEVCLAFLAEHWTAATIAEAVVVRARDLLAVGTGELRIRERVHAARLRAYPIASKTPRHKEES